MRWSKILFARVHGEGLNLPCEEESYRKENAILLGTNGLLREKDAISLRREERKMSKLQIEYIPKEQLKAYANNAKSHTAEQIEQIKRSIREFGFNDPIAVWHDDEIIEGHGRLMAVMDMDDIETVPVIKLDNLSDEERKAYALVHNKLTMNTGFDAELLDVEIESIDIDMEQFGFVDISVDWDNVPDLSEGTYEEPNHNMLECPACHHVDRDIHFKKV
jgi:hypothetical protein